MVKTLILPQTTQELSRCLLPWPPCKSGFRYATDCALRSRPAGVVWRDQQCGWASGRSSSCRGATRPTLAHDAREARQESPGQRNGFKRPAWTALPTADGEELEAGDAALLIAGRCRRLGGISAEQPEEGLDIAEPPAMATDRSRTYCA